VLFSNSVVCGCLYGHEQFRAACALPPGVSVRGISSSGKECSRARRFGSAVVACDPPAQRKAADAVSAESLLTQLGK